MEMMGQNVETVTDASTGYTIEGKGLDKKKNIKTEATFTSMSMVTQSPQGENNYDTSSIIGKPFGVTFSPLGKSLEYSGIDSTMVLNLGQGGTRSVKDLFRNPLQDMPDHPVKIGDTWTQSDSVTVPQGGLNITVKTEGTLTLKGFEEQDGFECAKIAIEGTGTIDGQGQQMGMDVAIEGDIESHGTIYFAYKKGVLVKSQSESFTEMTAALSGQMNMTIPISQESKSELKLSK
jgi:hypothetical protein